jgi:hypothetical protein
LNARLSVSKPTSKTRGSNMLRLKTSQGGSNRLVALIGSPRSLVSKARLYERGRASAAIAGMLAAPDKQAAVAATPALEHDSIKFRRSIQFIVPIGCSIVNAG